MQKKCDLYIVNNINSPELRIIKIYDKNFLYDEHKSYSGYLSLNIDRIKLIAVVSEFRKKGINCFSVPIKYRDNKNVTRENAFNVAIEYANLNDFKVAPISAGVNDSAPVFWLFNIINDPKEKAGGVVIVDRLDGHVWSSLEYEEYMYDYNNVF
jgi:hypothetical protein